MHRRLESQASISETRPLAGARSSLVLLLLINLFNYIDRMILAAVEGPIRAEFGVSKEQMGRLVPAFMVSYMLCSPVFGWLADRISRWLLIGIGVVGWSLASGASGLAQSFAVLVVMRCLIGVGEGAYGPAAPTLISDLYPQAVRGKVLAWFYAAIPVGSALGYAVGGLFFHHWHWAFYCTVPPGLALGAWCFLKRDPPRGASDHVPGRQRRNWREYLVLLRIRSYLIDTAGMTAMTFAIGGISFWMPSYLIESRHLNETSANLFFGGIAAAAGLGGTLAGGLAGDRLRRRFAGSYFLVSAAGMIVGFPMFLLLLITPFPQAWIVLFIAVFCLFFNTGPSNTILANVTPAPIRATAFAINIFIIHALGDVISPWIIGTFAEHMGFNFAFAVTSGMMLLGGLIWLWGMQFLEADTRRATVAV